MTTRKTLLLLRHAKSDWSAGTADDFSRPLSKRGRKDSPRMGAWVKKKGLVPDYIACSPASRARQTAELLCDKAGFDPGIIEWNAELYLADLQTLLEIARNFPEQANIVMLIGHNPGMETLLRYLAEKEIQPPKDGKYLPTATLARLLVKGNWHNLRAGSASLVDIMRPRNLPK
jgi:phosphohistidine phosphatase